VRGLLYRAVVAAAVGFVGRAPRPSRSSARWDACGGGLPPGSTAAALAEERGETGGQNGTGRVEVWPPRRQAEEITVSGRSPLWGAGSAPGFLAREKDVSAPALTHHGRCPPAC
jgi:hypothetical protein